MQFSASSMGSSGALGTSNVRIRKCATGAALLSLTVFVASCETTPTVIEKTTYVRPPVALITPTPYPDPPLHERRTNGELLGYCLAANAALAMCNEDKRRIREYPTPTPPEPEKPKGWFDRLFRKDEHDSSGG